jgi:alpha 1,3-glucosidase
MMLWHAVGTFYPFMRQHTHQEGKRREPYLFKNEIFEVISWSLRQRQLLMPYM